MNNLDEFDIKITMHEYDNLLNILDLKIEKLKKIESEYINQSLDYIQELHKKEEEKMNQFEENINQIEENIENVENDENLDQNNINEDVSFEDRKGKVQLPDDIKKIYYQISIKTHPDKVKNSENKEQLLSYFHKVNDAINSKNYKLILLVAYKLDIDITHIKDDYFYEIKEEIKILQQKITSIDYNDLWLWYSTKDPNLKNILFEKLKKRINL